MKWKTPLALLLSAVMLFCVTGCEKQEDSRITATQSGELIQLQEPEEGTPMAIVHTTMGDISFVLYEEQAPNTCQQFIDLVNEGFYTDRDIYGIEMGNVFTGSADHGGIEGKTTAENGRGYEPETDPGLWQLTGAVCAYGDRDGVYERTVLADSRFFMVSHVEADPEVVSYMEENNYPQAVIDAYQQVGGNPITSGSFTVFGQVVDGMDVLNAIAAVPTEEGSIYPSTPMYVTSIELSQYHREAE